MEKRLMTLLAVLFLFVGGAMAQTKVNGTVVSQDDGQPVIGATVMVVGTNIGTATNANGQFSLTCPAGKNTLRITYVGMEPLEVSARPNMRILLTSNNKALDEVIVVAYGTAKKSSFTGSAAAISSDKLESRPVSTVTKALDGQVAGVTVTSGGGQPGSDASIIVRGFGSINAYNDPLYVVDGIPYDGALNTISPQDIESMTVLKDASASALYGARAANGVVIITTKKGKEGNLQVTLHNTVGWSWRALPRYETVDQKEFVQITYEALRNNQQFGNGLSYDEACAVARQQLSTTFGGEMYNPFKNYTWDQLIDPSTGMVRADAQSAWNEDWLDGTYNKGALRHDHQLSVNGGTDRTTYLLSLGYTNEKGILVNTGFQRYNARTNIDTQITDWFKAGLSTSLAHTKTDYTDFSDTGTSNPWYTSQFMAPIYQLYRKDLNGNDVLDNYGNRQPDYGEDGRPTAADFNPLGDLTLDRTYYTTDNASVRANLTFGSDDVKMGWAQGLKLSLNFGGDYRQRNETQTMNKFHGNQKNAGGMISKENMRTQSYTFNQQLTWNRQFDKHSVGALFAHEFYQYTYNYLSAGRTNIVDGIDELRPGASMYDADSYSIEHDIESWLGRVNYNYDDKYYFDASIRRDGSSRFHKDNRWGTFWSVGGNWRVSAEEFMKPLTWVSNLNFKVSYGENGNENLQTYYAWQNLYSLAYPNGNNIGGFVSTLENKDLTWEKSGMLNIGLDGALFDSRLRFSIEYFNKKTTDMLLNYPMALSTGFTGYDANVGNMRNWGWEFMISGTLLKTKDVVWNMSWMGTAMKNKVLKLTEESNQIMNGSQIIKEGFDIHTFYVAKSAGVDPQTGAQLYWAYDHMDDEGNCYVPVLDAEGNEIGRTPGGEYITDSYAVASSHRYFAGKRTPDLYGSISTDLQLFRCIDLSIMTTYSIGGKIYDALYYGSMNNTYAYNTWSSNMDRRWRQPGDITDIPRAQLNYSRTLTDNFLVNASYFAIKNITLGYTLPASITRKAYMNKVRAYASFDNVAIFSHLKGMDPQYNFSGGTNYRYAPNKTFSLGLDINF